ncbi:MAG: AbrB/MazE/SpoVT family DNA-binding domain-containing protein, partial [Desulfobacterales bacterium]
MQTVTVSPKYQVVIPKNIRDALKLRPGQKMRVIEYDGRIELIPDRDISELRG